MKFVCQFFYLDFFFVKISFGIFILVLQLVRRVTYLNPDFYYSEKYTCVKQWRTFFCKAYILYLIKNRN